MDKSIGARLKFFRETILNMSQKALGNALGASQSNYGKIESGKLNIGDGKMQILHTKYKMNIHWVLTGEGSPQYKGEVSVNHMGDDAQQVNFIGDNYTDVDFTKERNDYGDTQAKLLALKKEVEMANQQRELYQKLYEKSEIEIKYLREKLDLE